jgi:hypothetical protein
MPSSGTSRGREEIFSARLASDFGRTRKERARGQLPQWRPAVASGKTAGQVRGHDFPQPDEPRAYLYGSYDIARNRGLVNVGTDHDAGAFAVASSRG